LYSSPDIIMNAMSGRIRWQGHAALVSELRNTHKIFVGKTEELFGR
jgi:hypothetical protein